MKSFYCLIFILLVVSNCVTETCALAEIPAADEITGIENFENPFGKLNSDVLKTEELPSKQCGRHGGGGSGIMRRLTLEDCTRTSCIIKVNKMYHGLLTFVPDTNYTRLNATIKAFVMNHTNWNASDPTATLSTKWIEGSFIQNRTESVNYELEFSTQTLNYKPGNYQIELRLSSGNSSSINETVICRHFPVNLDTGTNGVSKTIGVLSVFLLVCQQIMTLISKEFL